MYKLLCLLIVSCTASTHATVYVDPETQQENRCGGAIEADSGTLTFPAQGQSIQAGEICIWTIHLQSTETARLNFSNLDIAGDAANCGDGAVRLNSLTNLIPAAKAESYTFCNNEPPTDGNFYLSGSLLTVIFRTSLGSINAGSGFTLNWEGISFQPIPKVHESTYTSATSGIIRYPIDGDYPPNHVNTWLVKTIDANPDLQLVLNLAYVNLEQCPLADPCLCDALILYQVTPAGVLQENTRLCGNSSGTVLTSLGPNFILGFFTDHRESPGEGSGFEVVYKPQFPTTTTPPSTDPTTTRPPTHNETHQCGGLLLYGDQGYIDYKTNQAHDNDERCVWTVRSPNSAKIRFTIFPMYLENSNDYLTFHSVHSAGLTEEKVMTGRYPMKTTFSVNSSVALVSFYSDFSNVHDGFRIEFRAEGEPDASVNHYWDLNTIVEVDQRESLRYPSNGQYNNLELNTFVFTRPTRLPYWSVRATFNLLDLERDSPDNCKDKIHVYTSRRNTNPARELLRFTPVGGVCRLTQLADLPSDNMQILVVIFTTDEQGTTGEFNLEWWLQVPL